MLSEVFSIIAIVTLGTLAGAMMILCLKMMRMQRNEVQDLTGKLLSIAVSKNFQTYLAMQAEENPPAEVKFPALDDSSMAKLIAERYAEEGIDPALAYDNPIEDFGGPEAFR